MEMSKPYGFKVVVWLSDFGLWLDGVRLSSSFSYLTYWEKHFSQYVSRLLVVVTGESKVSLFMLYASSNRVGRSS